MSNKLDRIYRVVGGKVHLSDEDSALVSSLFEEAIKQARAEVLAAFIRLLDGFIPEGYPNLIALYRTTVREQLKLAAVNLPPAASDLEELLEKAREKGWNEAIEIAIKWNELSFSKDSFTKWMNTQRLEKARAISEEKSCTNGQPG